MCRKRITGARQQGLRSVLEAVPCSSVLNVGAKLLYKIMLGMADIDSHKLFCLRANIILRADCKNVT